MATSQSPQVPHRRRHVGDQPIRPATLPGEDGSPHNPHEDTPGHPDARGTLPMARYLTDPAIEDEIQALAAEAPLPTVDQAVRLVRLLRLNRTRRSAAG